MHGPMSIKFSVSVHCVAFGPTVFKNVLFDPFIKIFIMPFV